MTLISGVPSIGTTVKLGVDNPLGTKAIGLIPFLVFAFSPESSFPCGTSIPGFGIGGFMFDGSSYNVLVNSAFGPETLINSSDTLFGSLSFSVSTAPSIFGLNNVRGVTAVIPTAIPVPSSIALMGIGFLVGLRFCRRRKARG